VYGLSPQTLFAGPTKILALSNVSSSAWKLLNTVAGFVSAYCFLYIKEKTRPSL